MRTGQTTQYNKNVQPSFGPIVYDWLGYDPLKIMNLVRPQMGPLKYTRLTQLVQSDASTKRKS